MKWLFVRLSFYVIAAYFIVNLYNYFPLIFPSQESFLLEESLNENENQVSQMPVSDPTRLIIPKLGINTEILPVGKNSLGQMESLPDLKRVAWYEHGPRPGEFGNAVINGHEVDVLGFGVIFKNLHLLKSGDEIFVKTKSGEDMKFLVQNVETYDYKNAPLEKIFGATSSKNLNLITCSGDFIRSAQTKNKRVVIFATAI